MGNSCAVPSTSGAPAVTLRGLAGGDASAAVSPLDGLQTQCNNERVAFWESACTVTHILPKRAGHPATISTCTDELSTGLRRSDRAWKGHRIQLRTTMGRLPLVSIKWPWYSARNFYQSLA